MKSAYEIAMERLRDTDPDYKPLSEKQKKALAEIEKQYKAKIAEREIFLKDKLQAARANGRQDEFQKLERQLADDRIVLEEEMEAKKNRIRNGEAK